MNLIKVLNPETAKELAGLGFSYIKEQINKQDVYIFQGTPELIAHMSKNYSNKDYIKENKLSF